MSGREPQESENEKKQENYHFIKETIKRKPLNVGFYVRRVLAVTMGGVLFGCGAAVAFSVVFPAAAEKFIKREEVFLSDARPGPVGTGTPGEDEEGMESKASLQEDVSLSSAEQEADALVTEGVSDDSAAEEDGQSEETEAFSSMKLYASVYQDALQIASKPMKAMVRISGFTGDEDLLDNSFLTYGDEEGVVFLNNKTDLYVLTNYKGLEQAEVIRVTFCNGTVADGILCKADPRTGMAVVRVPLRLLSAEDRDEIYVASLSDSGSLDNEVPVVAIGSPSGNFGSIVYGLITSLSGRMTVADCEYVLLGTNIMGSSESSGVLLDMEGKIIGIIVRTQEDENILKAVSIAQLRPLIESLSNEEPIRYLGIRGAGITQIQAENLDIPKGIYVDGVDTDSPAMIAGIQSGDIITELNGEEMKDMEAYMTKLQTLAVGEKVKLTVCRRDVEGIFAEVEFELTIEEK